MPRTGEISDWLGTRSFIEYTVTLILVPDVIHQNPFAFEVRILTNLKLIAMHDRAGERSRDVAFVSFGGRVILDPENLVQS